MLQNTSPTLGINLDSKVLLPQESTLCRVGLGLSVGSYIPASDLEDGIYTKLPSPPSPRGGVGFERTFLCNYSWPGTHSVAPAGLELTTVFCLIFQNARPTGMHYHIQLYTSGNHCPQLTPEETKGFLPRWLTSSGSWRGPPR